MGWRDWFSRQPERGREEHQVSQEIPQAKPQPWGPFSQDDLTAMQRWADKQREELASMRTRATVIREYHDWAEPESPAQRRAGYDRLAGYQGRLTQTELRFPGEPQQLELPTHRDRDSWARDGVERGR